MTYTCRIDQLMIKLLVTLFASLVYASESLTLMIIPVLSFERRAVCIGQCAKDMRN